MERERFNRLIEYIRINKGKVFGGLIGFLIAILTLTVGFCKTIFIVNCVYLGFVLGTKSDNQETIKELLEKILSPIKRKQRIQ